MAIDLTSGLDRHVPFPTVFNFRDLGGYAGADGRVTKWRTLFRADGIHRLTSADLAPLGIRTVVDLRTPTELDERGRFTHDGIVFHHLPMMQTTWEAANYDLGGPADRFLADRYLEMLESGRDSIAGVVRLLSGTRAVPLVFHCAAGKDRTGVMAALTLGLLGVSEATIVADYALSRAATVQWIEWFKEQYPDKAGEIDSQPTSFMDSPAEAMAMFLTGVDERYGSVVGYAASVGVSEEAIERLRANLLD